MPFALIGSFSRRPAADAQTKRGESAKGFEIVSLTRRQILGIVGALPLFHNGSSVCKVMRR